MPAAALAVAAAVAAPVGALAMTAAVAEPVAADAAHSAVAAPVAAHSAAVEVVGAWHHHLPNLRSGLGTGVSTPARYSAARSEYRLRNGVPMAPASEIAGKLGENNKAWGRETHRLQLRKRENC